MISIYNRINEEKMKKEIEIKSIYYFLILNNVNLQNHKNCKIYM